MDIDALTARNIREAINFETLIACSGHSESTVEPLFESLSERIPLADPLSLHPNAYAEVIGRAAAEVMDTYLRVKARFLRLDDSDVVLKRSDDLYPVQAAGIPGSPRFLYLRGNIGLLDRRCVCVVGTRNPSDEGKRYARESARSLGDKGTVVISGLALGIDGVAHLTALASGFPTIAVIGTPLIESYPAEHRRLQQIIGERGLLVSRFAPSAQTQKWFFLLRNRLMSSLSEASVVVEDRDGGGAVKQAQYALKQGRRVVLFRHVWENRSLLWPRRLALKPGVLVVNRPEHIHARLFPGSGRSEPIPAETAGAKQFSLFDLY